MCQVNRLLVNALLKIGFVKNAKCNDLFQPIVYRSNKSIEEVIQSAGEISDISTFAANTTATGPGITTANPGRKATFTITSHDSRNFQRKFGGDVFVVKLKPEVGGDEITVESVNDRNDGTYLVEYTVDMLHSKWTLSVCLRGAHIKGSPFAVRVTPLNIDWNYHPAQPQPPQPASASTTSKYQGPLALTHQPASASTASKYQGPLVLTPQPASASTASKYQGPLVLTHQPASASTASKYQGPLVLTPQPASASTASNYLIPTVLPPQPTSASTASNYRGRTVLRPQSASASTASNYRCTSSPLPQSWPLPSQLTEELNRSAMVSFVKARGTRKRR